MFINNLEVFQTVTAVLIGGGELSAAYFMSLPLKHLVGAFSFATSKIAEMQKIRE